MEEKTYTEIVKSFETYLNRKKLRKTEERVAILEKICSFPGCFDLVLLQEKLTEMKFHVSKATLYNTLDVFTDANLIIRHQTNSKFIQYELRVLAESRLHQICMKCGEIRELKNSQLKSTAARWKTTRFTAEFFLFYTYGICYKCKRKEIKIKK
jgi:Fur family ferric uptake transcriptional regulator